MRFVRLFLAALVVTTLGTLAYQHHANRWKTGMYHVVALRDGKYIIEHRGYRIEAVCEGFSFGQSDVRQSNHSGECLYMPEFVGLYIDEQDIRGEYDSTLEFLPYKSWAPDTPQTRDFLTIIGHERE